MHKTDPLTSEQLIRNRAITVSSVRTGRGSRPEGAGAAACAVTVEVGWFVCVDPLTVHLVRLSGFFQLGQNETAAPLRRSIHLEYLGRPESGK